jgi:hypothetical protein
MSPSKAWPLLFALLCLALAAEDLRGRHIDPIVIGLIALATAPWSLPWFASLVQTLKVGSMELNFRQQIEQKIDDHEKAVAAALSSGIGRPNLGSTGEPDSSGLSHAVPAAPDRGHPSSADMPADAVTDPEDPNKGEFGGKPLANGRKLFADVKPFPGSSDLFRIRASVVSVDPTRPLIDDTTVTFYLHYTFPQRENRQLVKNGVATLECVAWGAFTLGVVVQEAQDTRLELDLSKDVPDAPVAFTSR